MVNEKTAVIQPNIVVPHTCPVHSLVLLDDVDGSITGWGFHVRYCPKVITGECEYVEPVDE